MYTLKPDASTGPLRIQAALDRYCSSYDKVFFIFSFYIVHKIVLKYASYQIKVS